MISGEVARSVGTAYGARPVSVDIARGRTLAETRQPEAAGPALGVPLSLTDQLVADRLSLAHWRPGHQVIVCALDGGTGRTTLAGLTATVLAELPYAHIWHPIALVESAPPTLGRTRRRWGVIDPGDPPDGLASEQQCTASGAWALSGSTSIQSRRDFSVLVVDSPAGLPSDLKTIEADPCSSVVLMTRPDRTSLSDAADALVWMNDKSLVDRNRVTVVINHGVGRPDRGSRAAATALGIRCAVIHSLPIDSALDPGRVLPCGNDMPVRLRRRVARICLDIWSQAQSPTAAAAFGRPQQQEQR